MRAIDLLQSIIPNAPHEIVNDHETATSFISKEDWSGFKCSEDVKKQRQQLALAEHRNDGLLIDDQGRPCVEDKRKSAEVEPDNPSAKAVDVFAQNFRKAATAEVTGQVEPTRYYDRDIHLSIQPATSPSAVADVAAEEEHSTQDPGNMEVGVKTSRYTIEKFKRGKPTWEKEETYREEPKKPRKCPIRTNKTEVAVMSRDELNYGSVFPLTARLPQVATHAYYLNGLAKSGLDMVSSSSAQGRMTKNFVNATRRALLATLDICNLAGIKRMKHQPYLPFVQKAPSAEVAAASIFGGESSLAGFSVMSNERSMSGVFEATLEKDEKDETSDENKERQKVFKYDFL